MERRSVLGLGLAGAAWLLAGGHTPYAQWTVYRKRFLLIGTSKADPPSYPLGKQIAAVIAEALPESRARPSRAPDQWRLASLIATDQMDVILLSRPDATALANGTDPFRDFGPVPLRCLYTFGNHLLLCRPDFPDRHAYLLAQSLDEHGGALPGATPAQPMEGPIAIHPGALAYAEAKPLPPADLANDSEAAQ